VDQIRSNSLRRGRKPPTLRVVTGRVVRLVFGGLLLVFAGVCVFAAYHTLSHLWGYRDSSTAFYIAVASVFAILAAVSTVGAVFLLRRQRGRPG
jgi:hypothetical protein